MQGWPWSMPFNEVQRTRVPGRLPPPRPALPPSFLQAPVSCDFFYNYAWWHLWCERLKLGASLREGWLAHALRSPSGGRRSAPS